MSVLLGNGNGTFQAPTPFAAGDAPRFITVADLDDDTVPDLVVANSDGDDVSVLLGNGVEVLRDYEPVTQRPSSVAHSNAVSGNHSQGASLDR